MITQNKFDLRLQNVSGEIWSLIAKIDEMKGQWTSGAKLSPQVLGRLKKSVLITSSGASTRIEGARLSDGDIEKLMRGISMQKFSNRDKQEVKGYFELLENLFNSWKYIHFNENTIKHFHKELLKFADKDVLHRGKYKKKENKVHMIDETGQSIAILFDTTSAYLVPKEMQELVDWTTSELGQENFHPLLIIGNFIVEFLNIHPFEDGNGRLSRVLTNLLLLNAGYLYMPYISHEKIIEDNKPDYYMSLRKSQKTFSKKKDNISSWLNFFFKVLLEQSNLAVQLLSRENIEKLLSPKQLMIWEYLKTVPQAGPKEISKATNIARPTINQALDRLMQFKKVERIGLGSATRYKIIYTK